MLSHEDIARGFMFEGQRWPLWNPQRGIFKPRGMPFLLSIRTVFPRKRGRIWSDDQRHVHQQIFAGDDELDDAFMGTDPSSPDNVWLREAAERQIPLIYFLGVSPGRYQAHCPDLRRGLGPAAPDRAHRVRRACWCYCHGHITGRGRAPLCPPPGQQRLHQASFRDSVLAAYDPRCAISNLPDDHLLDAAHIIADANELLGPAGHRPWHCALEDPPRRLRQPPDRDRSRRSRPAGPLPRSTPDDSSLGRCGLGVVISQLRGRLLCRAKKLSDSLAIDRGSAWQRCVDPLRTCSLWRDGIA